MRFQILFPSLFLLPFLAHGQAVENADKIAERVETLNPDIPVAGVSASPVEGLVEVRLQNNSFLYVTQDGRYIFSGARLLKTDESGDGVTDLTAQKKQKARQETLASVDLSRAITFRGQGADNDEVIVFTDTTCPYCQKFHSQIDKINEAGITVHYLAYPRKGVSSRGARILDVIWCSPKPGKALTLAKGENLQSMPEKAGKRIRQCASPVAEQYRLGEKLGVTGTPGIYTMDGRHLGGYVAPQDLQEQL